MRSALITIVHGRHNHLRNQIDGMRRSRIAPDQHIVVSMGDDDVASVCEPGTHLVALDANPVGLPLAAARNAGAHAALADGADALIFLDVDCVPDAVLIERYLGAVQSSPNALLSGPVTYLPPPPPQGYDMSRLESYRCAHPDRPMPLDGVAALAHELFWSLSFCLTAATWNRAGGFFEGYVGYGGEDTDFALVARGAGVAHLAVGGAHAYHQWHSVDDPPVQHVHDILRNGRVFRDRWGYWPMTGWLDQFESAGLVRYNDGIDDYEDTLSSPIG